MRFENFNYVRPGWYQFGLYDANENYVYNGKGRTRLECNGKVLIIDPAKTGKTHDFDNGDGADFKPFYEEFNKASWGTWITVYVTFLD